MLLGSSEHFLKKKIEKLPGIVAVRRGVDLLKTKEVGVTPWQQHCSYIYIYIGCCMMRTYDKGIPLSGEKRFLTDGVYLSTVTTVPSIVGFECHSWFTILMGEYLQ